MEMKLGSWAACISGAQGGRDRGQQAVLCSWHFPVTPCHPANNNFTHIIGTLIHWAYSFFSGSFLAFQGPFFLQMFQNILRPLLLLFGLK